MPKIAVGAAGPHAREAAQARGGEVRGIPLPALRRTGGVEEEVAVLGDEREEQTVDEAQQRAVVVVPADVTAPQSLEEPAVGGVDEEAGAQGTERTLDAA